MRRESMFSSQRMAELDQAVLERWMPEAFRRFQCIWLSATLDLPARAIAEALGLNISTVRRIRAEFARDGAAAIDGKGNHGGRRNQHMSLEQEVEFLREHADLAKAGGIGPFKEAFEARLGRAVHKTTIYRLLERHGMRKAPPRGRAAAPQARRRGGRRAR